MPDRIYYSPQFRVLESCIQIIKPRDHACVREFMRTMSYCAIRNGRQWKKKLFWLVRATKNEIHTHLNREFVKNSTKSEYERKGTKSFRFKILVLRLLQKRQIYELSTLKWDNSRHILKWDLKFFMD